MDRRRVALPLTVQQLWDAVKIIRYKRLPVNMDRISKYMKSVHNVESVEVTRQMNNCVRDGLIISIKKRFSKGSKAGVEQEFFKLPEDHVKKDSHDWYCFDCHLGGDVIACTSCYRVFHLACLSDDLPNNDVKHKFICYVCERIKRLDLSPPVKKGQLNRLLKATAEKLKDRLPVALTDRLIPSNTSYISERFANQAHVKKPSIDVPENFKWMLNDKDEWRIELLIFNPINLQDIVAKADSSRYDHLEELRADVQTIVHNVVIFHGVHSSLADMARLMSRDCNSDLQEMLECWLCYKRSNDKTRRNWFCKPCRPPHELVYAKSKPEAVFWPAKVLKKKDETYELRFFGPGHEKAIVQESNIRPISMDIHSIQVKGGSGWGKACEELKRYQKQLEKLRSATDDFTKPYVDSSSSSDSSDDEEITIDQNPDLDNGNEEYHVSKELEIRLQKTDELAVLIPRFKRKLRSETKEEQENIKNIKRGRTKRPDSDNSSFSDDKEIMESKPKLFPQKRKVSFSDDRELIPEKPHLLPEERIGEEEKKTLDDKPILLPEKRSVCFSEETKLADKDESDENIVVPDKEKKSKKHGRGTGGIVQEEETRSSKKKKKKSKTNDESRHKKKKFRKSKLVIAESDENDQSSSEQNDIGEYNITSTSEKAQALIKGNEEEIVSSSSSTHNHIKRSVKVQTKPVENKTNKDIVAKLHKEFEESKKLIIERLTKEHAEEIAMLKQTHANVLSETKKKQWCVNCEKEAIYHCCWNTSYCSPQCQLTHWAADHKRHCRRKR